MLSDCPHTLLIPHTFVHLHTCWAPLAQAYYTHLCPHTFLFSQCLHTHYSPRTHIRSHACVLVRLRMYTLSSHLPIHSSSPLPHTCDHRNACTLRLAHTCSHTGLFMHTCTCTHIACMLTLSCTWMSWNAHLCTHCYVPCMHTLSHAHLLHTQLAERGSPCKVSASL